MDLTATARTIPRLDVTAPFCATPEAQGAYVSSLYQFFLRRTPSPAEVAPWLPQIRAGATWQQLAAQFTASDEYWGRVGGDPRSFIQYLYHQLLSRAVDPDGEAYWLTLLRGGAAVHPQPISGDGAGGAIWAQYETQNQVKIAQGHAPVVLLGDSILAWLQYGAGVPVWQESYAPLGAVNLAVPGLSTSEVLWQVTQGQVAAVTPQVVQLMVGTNNGGIYGQAADAVVTALGDLCDVLIQQLPTVRILLLGLLPRGLPSDPLRKFTRDVNAGIARLADHIHVWVQDESSLFANGPLKPEYYLADNLHPSLAGYAALRGGTFTTLVRLLQSP